MKPFFNLVDIAAWRVRNAGGRPSSFLYSSATGVYLHRITFLADGRWCFADAYDKHAMSAQREAA